VNFEAVIITRNADGSRHIVPIAALREQLAG